MNKFAPSLLAVGLAAALVGCQENGPQDDKITIIEDALNPELEYLKFD